MSDFREIKKYGWKCYVSSHLLRQDRPTVEKMLRADIEQKVHREGFVPLTDTFDVRFIEFRDLEPWRLVTDEDRKMAEGDAVMAMVSIRCYADTPSSASP